MVVIKATLGVEIRKFTVDEDVTVNNLKFNIKQLFPALNKMDLEQICLVYQDSDGDSITVSSDQELRTAFSELGPDKIFRVTVRVYQPRREEDEEVTSGGDLFDAFHSLFDHGPFHHSPFHHHSHPHPFTLDHGPSWFNRQRALRLHEEKIRQQRLYEEKLRKARQEQMAALREKAMKEQEEMRKKATEERKKSVELQRRASQEGKPLIPQFPPGWQVQSFGSWDPVLEEGPNFSHQSWGPFGYVAYYDPSGTGEDEEEEMKTEEEAKTTAEDEVDKKEEETKKEEEMEASS